MIKIENNSLTELACTFIVLSYFLGIEESLNIFKSLLSIMNSITMFIHDTSILTVLFKYCITFPMVGAVLMKIGSPRGKKGYLIGKILYFIIGYVVGVILDFITNAIF